MVTSPLLHHLLWFRSDAHEICFRMGIVILNLIRTEIVTQKGIEKVEAPFAVFKRKEH